MFERLRGIYAAAITPLDANFAIDLDGFPRLLDFLAERGCHGALLFGTTGEGPSFAPAERLAALRCAQAWRKNWPDFRLLAGVGTPSLQETIELSQAAFEIGMDGVVVLPPYYFRKVSDEGLFQWFGQVIGRAVLSGQALFGYHFPSISGVPLSIELLARLQAAFPDRFAGLKDSSGEAGFASSLGARFGDSLIVLTGNDRLLSLALENQAAGAITAMANLYSYDLRQTWEAHERGDTMTQAQRQSQLEAARTILDKYPPFPPLLKALLARRHNFPRWSVRPPLLPLSLQDEDLVLKELNGLN